MRSSEDLGASKARRGLADTIEAKAVIDLLGGAAHVADLTGDSERSVQNWRRRGIPGWAWPDLVIAAYRSDALPQLARALIRCRSSFRRKIAA